MPPTRSFRHTLLLAATSLWVSLPFLAPFLSAKGDPAAGWLYLLFGQLCHQLPERSFELFGHQAAICHRCSGIYFGALAGLLFFPAVPAAARWLLQRPRVFLIFLIPMAVDVMLNNQALDRFLTGALAAFPVALFCWTAAEQLFQPKRRVEE